MKTINETLSKTRIKQPPYPKTRGFGLLLTLSVSLTLSLSFLEPGFAQEGPKLFEPYKPKPSGTAPEGWEIKILDGSSVDSTTVLKNGKEVKVSAPAYQLVPKEGAITFRDPGFEPELANAQRNTIGALLTQYSEKASDLQENLDRVVSQLEANLSISQTQEAETAVSKEEEQSSVKKSEEVEKRVESGEKKPIKKK